MPAKAPMYMKPNGGKNGAGNGKGGKKLRELLSTEMISLPLGDFRHMAHVGRGGADDMFGDTTFLQTKSSGTDSERANGGMKRKGSGRSSKKTRNNSVPDSSAIKSEKTSLSNHSYDGYGPTESPILQSAFSLPLLNQQSTSAPTTPVHNGEKENNKKAAKKTKKTMNNNCISNGKATSHETGLDNLASTPNSGLSGPPKPRRLTVEDDSTANGHISNGIKENGTISKQVATEKPVVTSPSDTTSIDEGWALELDLGSSLMDDVMGVMDKIEL